jgi:mannose-6-phosphate isomerase-like protein (cupin superfamily)
MARVFGFYAAMTAASLLLTVFALALSRDGGSNEQEKSSSQRIPSAPAQPYVVTTAHTIDGTVKELHSANKLQDLINGANIGCRVFVQHEADVATNQGEVHDAADDIFIILDGSAIFILGGTLDGPKETQPGEWRAAGISGGKEFKVNKGDIIIVPRGTPHRRVTSGLDVTLMLVKSFTPVKK